MITLLVYICLFLAFFLEIRIFLALPCIQPIILRRSVDLKPFGLQKNCPRIILMKGARVGRTDTTSLLGSRTLDQRQEMRGRRGGQVLRKRTDYFAEVRLVRLVLLNHIAINIQEVINPIICLQ
jgi:hypothetical protein